MTNPFDDPDGTFHVLVNDEGQHSLWPSFVDIPAGWTPVVQDESRETCLDYVEEHWTDMRPVPRRWCSRPWRSTRSPTN
ncbi:MbtH family protein [Actinopolymorpha sp. B11F2]|uniref:MbtH family protein n=1 Tax=Actinopolymorpha sp. B11F2 TaxID=3160862 RepID=UPI0032E375D1